MGEQILILSNDEKHHEDTTPKQTNIPRRSTKAFNAIEDFGHPFLWKSEDINRLLTNDVVASDIGGASGTPKA